MKKILLLHGYNGFPEVFNWIKEELEKNGYKVIMPNFPVQKEVRYNIWKEQLDKIKEELNGELIVVVHSIGNPFLIKYLKEFNLNIKLYIGMAGFSDIFETNNPDLNAAIKNMVPNIEEMNNFKLIIKNRICIYSDNDHIIPIEILKKHVNNIDGIDYFISNIGHMGKKSGLTTLPEIVNIIKETV